MKTPEQWTKARDASAVEWSENEFGEAELFYKIDVKNGFKAGYDAAREQFLKDLGPVLEEMKNAKQDLENDRDLEAYHCIIAMLEILDALGVKP